MSSYEGEYTLEEAKRASTEIKRRPGAAEDYIQGTNNSDVIEYLLNEGDETFASEPIDVIHDGERGIGQIRTALLSSSISPELKRDVVTRRSDVREKDIAVPDDVWNNALGALAVGKPVVLYGPTGTGKTTLARQLAMEVAVGYDIETATPSWTDQDITGRVAPEYNDDTVGYTKEPGCVSQAVLRAKEFDENWGLIIDELTRADISRIFGPLYTAIEDRSQELFETDDGVAVTLEPRVKIICTMNVSDRTVNELDDAITRRFAMIKVGQYTHDSRDQLFQQWVQNSLKRTPIDLNSLIDLFHADYQGLNFSDDGDATHGIREFGPMHYRDVVDFLSEVTAPERGGSPGTGVYNHRPAKAVGQAFRIYILPRLLNDATYSQMEKLPDHYKRLNKRFDQFDLSPAVNLAEQRLQSEDQRLRGQ